MKASIQAVAAEAGVSISTVSRTFAKPNLVLPETRSKVMAAAEKLDYRISRSAAALKTGQSFRVALLMSDPISTWFNSNTYAGLDSVLHPAGYDISIFEMADAHDRHEFFATLPGRRNVDAVIVNSFNIVPEEVEKLSNMKVPIVGINIPSINGFNATVSIDDVRPCMLLWSTCSPWATDVSLMRTRHQMTITRTWSSAQKRVCMG